MSRENNYIENYKNLIENKNKQYAKQEKKLSEAAKIKEKFKNDYHSILESREAREREHGKLLEACRDDAFSTVIKAIYISALEANTLTDDGLALAESMVDSWIKENGGARSILNKCKNKTYLLNRISEIVEEAALLEAEDVEETEKEVSYKDTEEKEEEPAETKETKSDDAVALALKVVSDKLGTDDEQVKNALELLQKKSSGEDTSKEEPAKEDDSSSDDSSSSEDSEEIDVDKELTSDDDKKEEDGDDKEEVPEEPSKDESSDSDKEDEKKDDKKEEEDEEEKLDVDEELSDNKEFDDIEPEKSEDEEESEEGGAESEEDGGNETDTADDIVDDLAETPEEDITVNGDENNNGKIFDELDKEQDVKKAVELIRQRVADAEQTFIKRNREDKKAIDELIGRISDNVKTVEDLNDANNDKSKVAEESARMYRRKINSITENRPLSILEKMTRNMHTNIVKDSVLKEQFITESGNIDTSLIVESSKVMYAFLETLNTLQLENVNAKYLEKVLNEMD